MGGGGQHGGWWWVVVGSTVGCGGQQHASSSCVVLVCGPFLSPSPPAASHLKSRLPELLKAVADTDPGQGVHDSGLTEVSPEVLHTLLLYLLDRTQNKLGLSQDAVEAFVATIRRGG